jgi:Type III flagellar switch regulator (C-ring) FliN C-term
MLATVPSTGDVRALCWRSEAELHRLGTGLQAALDRWADGWGLSRPTIAVDNAWQAGAPTGMVWHPLASGGDGKLVAWLGHLEQGPMVLERLLFGVTTGANATASVARSLAEDALAALRHHVVQWLGAEQPVSDMDDVPSADGRPWSGAVRAAITLEAGDGNASVWLHIRAGAWPLPGPRHPVSRVVGLSPINDALVGQTVKLQARLDDVHVSLGELIGLCEGDVLVTGHRLDAPLAITSPDQEEATVFHGHLAQRQGRMAVTLLQTH